KYSCMKQEYKDKLEYITNFYMDFNWKNEYVGLLTTKIDNITYYFIDNKQYFTCLKPYTEDPLFEIERFSYFSKAVLSSLPVIDFKPDLIHCHDWQTGLVPVYLKERFQDNIFFQGIKSVMTIHNLKFQGKWNVKDVEDITGLSGYYFSPDKLEFHKDADLLKGGLVYADAITTVSPTYAEEIKTEFYGEGLEGLLNARANDLRGIVNGIDYDAFNPATDKYIAKTYDAISFRKEKIKNKRALQEELGLARDDKVMMIGLVSRLTDQKGFDLIAYVMDELCQDAVQIVVLGTGEEQYENMFRYFDWKYKDKVSANITYSEALSHKIYASCDSFLMPSLFEPCGLSQLMSLRYGTIPIVRETGGLKDTVEPYNEYEGTGTGFSFTNYNAHEMLRTIRYAEQIYYDRRREWNKMIDRAMAADFSWKKSAEKYQEMYDWLIRK
ncbi:MAG: glycogen/starch synthase, partial [Lachnospiraceae bacterium]|nr:glycogen/starch synthase [Lachnospiraceae bacterium]